MPLEEIEGAPGGGPESAENPGQMEMPEALQPEQPAEAQEPINLVDLIEQPAWKTILIDLIKSNKMDPWDIDIVELADLYLHKIQTMERADLRIPANAILASAILLKLKARTIKLTSIDDEEETTEISKEEIQFIEESIPDLAGQRQFRGGKVTLDELVLSIEQILQKTKQKKSILRDKSIPDFKVYFNTVNIEERIGRVLEKIKARADSQGLVMFSAILDEKTPVEMVNCFIPMLFLVNKGKINAWQEEWFGEIFIALQKEIEKEAGAQEAEKKKEPAAKDAKRKAGKKK